MFAMPNKFRLAAFSLAFFFIALFGTNQKIKAEDGRRFIYPSADATVYSNAPNQNYPNYTYLETSYATGPTRQQMVYFKFSVTGLPTNATIVNAKLWLTLKSCDGTVSPNNLNVGKVNADWTETTITWNNRPNFSGGSSASASCSQTDWPFDVTNTVRDWLSGATPNYGLAVYGPKSGEWKRSFYSREYDSETDQPQLAIYYTIPDSSNPDNGANLPGGGSTGINTPPAASNPSTSTPSTGSLTVAAPKLSYVWRSGTGAKADLSRSNEVEADAHETITVVGTSKAGYKVSLFIDTKTYTTTTNSLGYWAISFKASDFADGTYSVKAQAQNSAGQSSNVVTLFSLNKIDLEAIALQFHNESLNDNGLDNFTGLSFLSPIFASMFNFILCICCLCSCLALIVLVVFLMLKKGKKKEDQSAPPVSSQPSAQSSKQPTNSISTK